MVKLEIIEEEKETKSTDKFDTSMRFILSRINAMNLWRINSII